MGIDKDIEAEVDEGVVVPVVATEGVEEAAVPDSTAAGESDVGFVSVLL
jgi:hypothetical protein